MSEDTPTESELAVARSIIDRLPDEQRHAIAEEYAPPPPPSEPGIDRPYTQTEARELLFENPEKFHALLDAQSAGGPKLIELNTEEVS